MRSFPIVTTAPKALLAELHDCMSVSRTVENWPAWLSEEPAAPAELKALLAPYPSNDAVIWPVARRVGNVNNKDSALIEPGALAG
jgi:putative SOS response-associated peptidase YedK